MRALGRACYRSICYLRKCASATCSCCCSKLMPWYCELKDISENSLLRLMQKALEAMKKLSALFACASKSAVSLTAGIKKPPGLRGAVETSKRQIGWETVLWSLFALYIAAWACIGNDVVASVSLHTRTTGHGHHHLAARLGRQIGHRCGLCTYGQTVLPDFIPSLNAKARLGQL